MKKILITMLAITGLSTSIATSNAQETIQKVTGEVVSIRTGERTITIKENTRAERDVYQVPEGTKIYKEAKEIRFRDLKQGDIIEARFIMNQDARVLTSFDYNNEEIEGSLDQIEPAAGTASVTEAEEEVAEVLPAVLPKTASSVPLYGLLALLLISFAGLIRFARKSR